MYVVEVFDAQGDPAEFTVMQPVVALDLVLRARRASLYWQVRHEESGTLLPLEDIRHHARSSADADPVAAHHLVQTDREDEGARRAALN